MINKIDIKINRSRVKYAITLAKSLSPSDTSTINKIWELVASNLKKNLKKILKHFMELLLKIILKNCN